MHVAWRTVVPAHKSGRAGNVRVYALRTAAIPAQPRSYTTARPSLGSTGVGETFGCSEAGAEGEPELVWKGCMGAVRWLAVV
jgi:hypothetical protein